MKKLLTFLLIAIVILSISACGKTPTASNASDNDDAAPAAQSDNSYPGGIAETGGIKIGLPDNTWSHQNKGMMGIYLMKDGHYYKNYPTVKVLLNDTGIDQSIADSNSIYPASEDSSFEMNIGGYNFRGNQAIIEGFTKTDRPTIIDRLYYAVSENRTLYFQLYVENGCIEGVDRNNADAQTIIKSVIELNGFKQSGQTAGTEADTNVEDSSVLSGIDKNKAKWSINENGLLKIQCTNGFESHMNSNEYPWYKYSDKVTSLEITGKITEIPPLAFSDFKKLETISLPDSINTLKISCFKNCTSLKALKLPDSLKSTEYFVFSGCESIEELTIPGGIKQINNYNFAYCTSLKTVKISSGVTSMGYDVFDGCTSLTTLYLPKSVTLIDLYSFRDTALKDIYYEGTKEDFEKISIKNGNDPLSAAEIHYQSFK